MKMTDPIACEINLDNSSAIYYSGQNISGIIDIKINRKITVKRLVLHVTGLAECKCTSGEEDEQMIESILFSNIHLVPNKMELFRGTLKYNFNFILPPRLPSSDKWKLKKSKHEIKYKITVYFVRPWKFTLDFDKEFRVVSGFDLSLCPELNISKAFENESMIVSVPRTGYVAGEEIPVQVRLKNPYDNRIQGIYGTLQRDVRHKFPNNCCSGSRSRNFTSENVFANTFLYSAGNEFYCTKLKIPEGSTTSTVYNQGEIINIQYKISIKIMINQSFFNSKSSELHLPITIGVVKMLEQPENQNSQEVQNLEFEDNF